VAEAGQDPADHFLRYGRAEGRFPNADLEAQEGSVSGFDPAWYLERYPDVAEAGQDPADHFLRYGRAEGRFPNADLEAQEGSVSGFDPAWYLKRYPDVAEAGQDPADHFLRYGRAEGRFPNAKSDSRELWSELFDPAWYLARYKDVAQFAGSPLEHFIHHGILEERAPNAYAEKPDYWRNILDPDWYQARYEDVKNSDIDPLAHFILYGIVSDRKANKDYYIPSTPLESSELICRKKCANIGDSSLEFGLFVTHSPNGYIKPHVETYIKALIREKISVILIISTNAHNVSIPNYLIENCAAIFQRTNRGYDFAAWAHVIKNEADILKSKTLYLFNDSVVGPVGQAEFKNSLKRIRDSEYDVIGLTDNLQLGWHLQSYFLAFKPSVLVSDVFSRFLSSIVEFSSKYSVIYEYETQLTRILSDAGFNCVALFPATEMTNYTAYRWRQLLDNGFPFIKVNILVRLIARLDITCWRERLRFKGYDTTIADETLALIANSLDSSYVYPYYLDYGREKTRFVQMHNFFAAQSKLQLAANYKSGIVLIILSHNEAEVLFDIFSRFRDQHITWAELHSISVASTDDTVSLSENISGCKFEYTESDQAAFLLLRDVILSSHGRPIFIARNLRSGFDSLMDFIEIISDAYERGYGNENQKHLPSIKLREIFEDYVGRHNLCLKWRAHPVEVSEICLFDSDECLLVT
ncbi:rhamnan synthesis F family protein, partial [Methylobacterium mesophilicum]